MIQCFKGSEEHSSPSETEVEKETMDCKIEAKTRLRSNYSYYVILIVDKL